MIRAAIAANIRPTALIFREQPSGEWREHDFLLLEALQLMEQERCGQCGLPKWMCHDETGGVQIALEQDECIAKRIIDAQNEKDSQNKNVKNHGKQYWPRPYFVDDFNWVTVRDAYYQAEIQRAKDREGD